MPDLTMVIPVYDELALLPVAIESVLAQRGPEVEIVLVNDNPEHLSETDFAPWASVPGLRIVHHDRNRGLAASRNTGIDAATGDFVGFLDADDYLVPDALRRQLESATAQTDMLHGLHWRRQPGQTRIGAHGRENARFARRRVDVTFAEAPEAQFINSACHIYRRDFLDGAAIRFDLAQPKFEDRLFVLRVVTTAHRITFTGEVTLVYCRRTGSITTSAQTLDDDLAKITSLEKSRTLIRDYVARADADQCLVERERFLALYQLMLHPGLLDRLGAAESNGRVDLAARASALVLGPPLSDVVRHDDVVRASAAHRRLATRVDGLDGVDALQDAIAEGRHAEAARMIAEARTIDAPTPERPRRSRLTLRRRSTDLVVHCGLPGAGDAWLAQRFRHRADQLAASGVYVAPHPADPLARDVETVPGGADAPVPATPWEQIAEAIGRERPRVAVVSIAHLLEPWRADGRLELDALAEVVGLCRSARAVAFVRRPDRWIESLYAQQVARGTDLGRLGPEEFALEHGHRLADLPTLTEPLESAVGGDLALGDFDDAVARRRLWQRFWELAGRSDVGDAVVDEPMPVETRPDATAVVIGRAIASMVDDPHHRRRALDEWFALSGAHGAGEDAGWLTIPRTRRRLIDETQRRSADWLDARGYRFDASPWLAEVEQSEHHRPRRVDDEVERAIRAYWRSAYPAD